MWNPSEKEAKKAFDYASKSPNNYIKMNEMGKRAFWQYGKSKGIFNLSTLGEKAKSEYSKYVTDDMPYASDNPMERATLARQSEQGQFDDSEQVKTSKIQDRRLLNESRLEALTPTIKPQPIQRKQVPIRNERAGTFDKNKPAFDPVKGLGNLAMNTLSTVNSVLQTPATMGKYGVESMEQAKAEGKSPIGGLLKGYATGLGKAITNQDAVENTEVLEGVAPKTTEALKQKFPNTYNAVSTIVNLVGVDDLTAIGLIGDIAKIRKLNKGINTTADLVRMSEAGIKDAKKVAKLMQNPDVVRAVDGIPEKELNSLPKAKQYKTLTKEISELPADSYVDEYLDSIGEYEKMWQNQTKPIEVPIEDTINKVSVKKKAVNQAADIDKDLITKAKKQFGTTSNPIEAGYLLEDGSMLDFSGKRDGGLSNVRYMDHREIQELFDGLGQIESMTKFMDDTGSIRMSVSQDGSVMIDITGNKPLTQKQVEKIKQIASRKKYVAFDYYGDVKSKAPTFGKELEYPTVKDIDNVLQEITANKSLRIGTLKPEFIPSTITRTGTQKIKPPLEPLQPPKLEAIPQRKAIGQTLKPIGDLRKLPVEPQKLISNINTPPIENKSLTGALNKQELAKNKPKGKIRSTLSKIYSATVDNTQTTAKVSKEAEIMSNVARNSGATVDTIIKKGLVNMEGKRIEGKAIADIFNLPKNEAEALEQLLFETHNIDRVKQAKELTSHSIEESKIIIDSIKSQYPHLEAKAKEVNTLLTNMLDEWGVKSGLVDTDLRNLLRNMYQNYVPGYREMPGVDATSFKSRGMGPAKIINRAIGGDEKLMSLQKSIPMMINKMVKSARKNELYRKILEAAQKGSDYAKILKPTGKIEEVVAKKANDAIIEAIKADGIDALANITDSALTADPKLGYLLTVMDNGKPVKLQIKEDLFKSLQALNSRGDDDLQTALKLFKKGVTNPFKSLITGYNPLFAVRNISRDIPTAFVQGTENNPIKFAKNLYESGKDMLTKADRFQEYKALGGEGGNYFNIEKGLKTEGKLEKVLKPLAAINNFTETLPRYGEYLGTLKREGTDYATKMKALHNAQEVTVNFGRHGDVTKAIDAIVPYLNPAVQGLDKTARTFKKPEAWAKALGVISIPTAAVYAINQVVDKKGYDQLDNRTKDTYFVFPMGDGKFAKIPKTRESGAIFGALFERILRQAQDKPEAFKNYGNALKTNFLFQNPWTDNIASPLVTGIGFNKDFAGRNVVPTYMINDKRSPKLQYDERTSEIAKEIGDKFNLSPKQIDYIIKSYGGIVGSILIPATTKGGNVIDSAVTRSFTADAAYSNEITNNFYDKLDKLKNAATDKNITGKLPSKLVTPEEKMSNLYASMTRHISDIRDGISRLGSTDEARQRQQQLLDILTELNKDIDYNQADKLKQQLIAMAQKYKESIFDKYLHK